jgi:hypothetical protein
MKGAILSTGHCVFFIAKKPEKEIREGFEFQPLSEKNQNPSRTLFHI